MNEIVTELIKKRYENIKTNPRGEMYMSKINELSKEGLSFQKKFMRENGYKTFAKYSEVIKTSMLRLMDSLNKKDQNAFMGNVIDLYSRVSEPVPQVLIDSLSDVDWVTSMYAFLVGLHGSEN